MPCLPADVLGHDDVGSRSARRRAVLTERPGRLLLVVGLLCLFGPLCIDMYLPALPRLSTDLHASTSSVQLSLTACLVGIAAGQILIGPLSDRYGRRRPLGIGLVLFIGASLACAFAPGIAVLTACRLMQGIGGSAGIVIASAVVRDLFSGVRAATFFSRLFLVIGVGPVLAPQIGAELLRVSSWRGVFVTLSIFGAVLLVMAMTELPETLPLDRRHRGGLAATLRSMRLVLVNRPFLASALCCGLAFGSVFAYVAGSSFILENLYGLSPQGFSIVFAANAVGLIAASQFSARFVSRVGPSRTLSAGVTTLVGGALWLLLVVLVLPRELAAVVPPLFLIVTSLGLIGPNATALALENFPHSAGSAAAVLGVLQFGIGALVAPLVGIGGSHDALPMALLVMSLATGAVACRVWSRASVAADHVAVEAGLDLSAQGEPARY